MNKMICRMALALAVASLAGCGLKGPLYFPPQEQPKQQPLSSAPTPATPAGETSIPVSDTNSTDRARDEVSDTSVQEGSTLREGNTGRMLTPEPETQSAP